LKRISVVYLPSLQVDLLVEVVVKLGIPRPEGAYERHDEPARQP
jgi:hypothetical protein